MTLPTDPFILYSAVNMQLRDQYSSLEELCSAENIDRAQLTSRLHEAGFDYDPDINQFR